MSGETDEDQPRYNEMLYKIHSNNSNRHEMQAPAVPVNIDQFYGRNTTACDQPGSSNLATSRYAPSEDSVFKLPNTIRSHNNWNRYETEVTVLNHGFRYGNVDKCFLKLWVKVSFEILKMAQMHSQPQVSKTRVDQLIGLLTEHLNSKYCGGRDRIPSSVSSVGLQSESSQIDPFGSIASLSSVLNDNRELTSARIPNRAGILNPYGLDVTANGFQSSAGYPNLYGAINRTTSQPQISDGPLNPLVGMNRAISQPQISRDRTFHPISARPEPTRNDQPAGVGLDTTNNVSKAASRSRQLNSTNRGDRELLALKNANQPVFDTSRNESMACVKGMTRYGRPIKSPNKFWKGIESKMNEPSIINYSRSKKTPETSPCQDLNETLTLRNNKLIVKNTPLSKYKKTGKNAALPAIDEQENKPVNKKKLEPKKPAKRKSSLKENKENTENTLKGSQEKKLSKKVVSKVAKKPPVKRKNKNNDITISKRKKVEESVLSDCSLNSDSDELFEPLFTRRKTQNLNQVLSPSNGLHSVKRALTSSNSKETPPAKLLSQFIEQDVPTSSAKGAPEPMLSHVVKRVTKMVEKKGPKKVVKKTGATKNSSEDPLIKKIMDDVLNEPIYTSKTPDGKTTLAVFQSTDVDSDDESYASESDEDDDIL